MKPVCAKAWAALCFFALILSPEPSLQGQVSEGSSVAPMPLALVLEDRDADFVPDRLGDTLKVSGIITQPVREARTGWWYVVIQDNQAGLRLLSSESQMLQGLEPGAVVEAEGVLSHRRGSEELLLATIVATGETRPVEAREALAADLDGEALMHRLVRVDGVLRDFDLSAQSAVIQDRSGEVLNMQNIPSQADAPRARFFLNKNWSTACSRMMMTCPKMQLRFM